MTKLYRANNSLIIGYLLPGFFPVILSLLLVSYRANYYTYILLLVTIVYFFVFSFYYFYFIPIAYFEGEFIKIKSFLGLVKLSTNNIRSIRITKNIFSSFFDLRILSITTDNENFVKIYLPFFEIGKFEEFILQGEQKGNIILFE
jgi:hypothetical protein